MMPWMQEREQKWDARYEDDKVWGAGITNMITKTMKAVPQGQEERVGLATGPGNPAAVRVWTAKIGRFGSRTGQKPDPQTLGGPNPDSYPSTRGFRLVWLDPSVPISGSAFRDSHLWSHSDTGLLIVKY
jgi:hypothetical protein